MGCGVVVVGGGEVKIKIDTQIAGENMAAAKARGFDCLFVGSLVCFQEATSCVMLLLSIARNGVSHCWLVCTQWH